MGNTESYEISSVEEQQLMKCRNDYVTVVEFLNEIKRLSMVISLPWSFDKCYHLIFKNTFDKHGEIDDWSDDFNELAKRPWNVVNLRSVNESKDVTCDLIKAIEKLSTINPNACLMIDMTLIKLPLQISYRKYITENGYAETKLNPYPLIQDIILQINNLKLEDQQTVLNVLSEKLGDLTELTLFNVNKTWYTQAQLKEKWPLIFKGRWELLFKKITFQQFDKKTVYMCLVPETVLDEHYKSSYSLEERLREQYRTTDRVCPSHVKEPPADESKQKVDDFLKLFMNNSQQMNSEDLFKMKRSDQNVIVNELRSQLRTVIDTLRNHTQTPEKSTGVLDAMKIQDSGDI